MTLWQFCQTPGIKNTNWIRFQFLINGQPVAVYFPSHESFQNFSRMFNAF